MLIIGCAVVDDAQRPIPAPAAELPSDDAQRSIPGPAAAPPSDDARRSIPAPAAAPPSDLPLTLVPAAKGASSVWFGIFLSGDGGWAPLDGTVSRELAKRGIPVVGWDSRKYFWKARTPGGASADLDRVIRYYSQRLSRTRALLMGFSQGADTLPFMLNRLPSETRAMADFAALLGLSQTAVWHITVADLLGKHPLTEPTAPELAQWRGPAYACLYGETDADAACDVLTGPQG